MTPPASSSYDSLFQNLYFSRRLLLHGPLRQTPNMATPPSCVRSTHEEPYYPGNNSFDSNVVMVLSVLLCAVICSLGLNSIIRCALRCPSLVSSDTNGHNSSARLANTGVKIKTLKTFPIVNYSTELKLPGLVAECIICLSEFATNDRVRILPKCHHRFHVQCIDKWLNSHSSCPTCRHCLIETCQKTVDCGSARASTAEPSPSSPTQAIQITLAPLEPEGPVRGVSYLGELRVVDVSC
ncbi:RING-H2 finger protein ATL78-like [Syzygium oleosum]|uniref:RING-H2 finger protein ATL78-like n=1 Tax=Syzygium oleosum TaxID=219896 RepID=UPI0011D1A773|nr:RING-H2 finger protein ATL78-like [Syzygium oleosum]